MGEHNMKVYDYIDYEDGSCEVVAMNNVLEIVLWEDGEKVHYRSEKYEDIINGKGVKE